MASKNILKTLTEQEMDRKTFLKYGGLAVLGLVGFKTFVTMLTQTNIDRTLADKNRLVVKHGFGNGKYGA